MVLLVFYPKNPFIYFIFTHIRSSSVSFCVYLSHHYLVILVVFTLGDKAPLFESS